MLPVFFYALNVKIIIKPHFANTVIPYFYNRIRHSNEHNHY